MGFFTEGSPPGLQTAAFCLCLHMSESESESERERERERERNGGKEKGREGERQKKIGFIFSSYKNTNPIMESASS